ncbi:ryanodine receptor 3-like [Oncorhynchus masou masou]|uniref:ryanodine receptor 3-like n=1 Tax=Oncorhynchus masou masou TaxID=90313 RepID=UPI003182D7DF
MAEGGEGEDEIQFLRTDDEVVLQCVACIHKENRKFCLTAEGLGNRLCYLEPTSEAKYVPPDLCICNFVLEHSLSVRALQEMLAKTGQNSEGGIGSKFKQSESVTEVPRVKQGEAYTLWQGDVRSGISVPPLCVHLPLSHWWLLGKRSGVTCC